jgi:hypothetical protein
MVFSTAAHVAIGDLPLAMTAVLALEVWRHLPARHRQEVPHGKAIAA